MTAFLAVSRFFRRAGWRFATWAGCGGGEPPRSRSARTTPTSKTRTLNSRSSTRWPTRPWAVPVQVKLLLDENISPKVGEQLRKDGVDACGVRDRGLLEAEDNSVLEKAFAEDRILVTKNVADLEKVARSREIHAGIVLIEDNDMNRADQLDVLRKVVARLEK